MSNRTVQVAYLMTALTGAAGLIDQIAWQRYLGRLLGSDSLATATVLGVFLGGLSLGYLAWGFLSSRVERPFVIYGALEAVIGVWAIAFAWLFVIVDRTTASWGFAPGLPLVVQGSICAALLIGIPTLCMGATVPLLTQALSTSAAGSTAVNARIYAYNTFGAVAGTLAAGFVCIRWLGLPGTLRVAGIANLIAAAYFLVAGRRVRSPSATPAEAPPRQARPAVVGWSRALVYGVGFVAGFAFMTLESLVIRVTSLSVGSSTYSLSLVIAAFLLSIAAGAFVVGRRRRLSVSSLAINQSVACLALMPLFLTLDKWPYIAHVLRARFDLSLSDFAGYHAVVLVALAAVLAVPVGCMGATLPLAFDALKSGLGRSGRTAGLLFGWNALGNLLGGLLGGFLFYRFLGIGETFMLVVGLIAVSAAMASVRLPRKRRALGAIAPIAAIAFIWLYPAHDPLRFAVGTFHLREPLDCPDDGADAFYRCFYSGKTVLAYRDDPEASLAVVENPRFAEALRRRFPSLTRSIVAVPSAFGEEGPRPRSILINGKPDSSTFYDRETLRLAAHLPALTAPARDRVLVIGLGTGVTVGELARYSDIGSIDVAEIAPGVVQLLPLFADWTGSVHEDPRVHLHVGDALRVLRRSEERWDLIVSEPSNPWTSGVDQLFSREFYRMVRERLEPDGMFLSWIQRYATNETIAAIALNTLRSEFPHVRVFRAGSDDLLLASPEPIGPEALVRAGDALLAHPPVRESLAEIRVDGVADLLAREHPEVIERASELTELGLETLDRPRIHFLAGIAFFRGDDPDAPELARTTHEGLE